jgi:restriction system protein
MVLNNVGEGPDGGVDIWLRKNGEVSFVQCKHWKSGNVGVTEVRELHGAMAAESVRHGTIVTYGGFTPDAIEFARANSIELVDGPRLTKMIAAVQQSSNSPAQPEVGRTCPKCGSEMVLRVARKGPYAGKKFWGCSRFPDCRGLVFAGD